jgi:hypothetical protein
MATSTPDKRKRRQKATTEVGRQMMQRERQRLAKEQAALGEALANEASAWREQQRPIEKAPRVQVGINRSVVRRVAAVLATEGVMVPIRCEAAQGAQQMSAWTDFERIAIRYVAHEDVRLLAATLRGLLYHEGGHIRWTVPFVDLAAMAGVHVEPRNPDQRTKALHTAWNCLEDQRMETAVVSDSPRKAAYFTPLLMTEHCSTLDKMAANWPLLVWRRYLPNKLRTQARSMFVTKHNLLGQDGEDLARRLDEVVTRYVTSTDPHVMWSAVVDMLALLQECQPLASDMADAGHNQQVRGRQLPEDFQGLTIPVSPDMIPDDAAPAEDEPEEVVEDDVTMTLDDLSDAEVEHVMEVLTHVLIDPQVLVEVRYVIEQHMPSEGEGGGAGSLLEDEAEPAKAPESAPRDPDAEEAEDEDAEDGAGDEVEEDDEAGDGTEAPGSDVIDDEADDDGMGDDEDDADEDGEAGEDDDESHGGSAEGSHGIDPSSEDAETPFDQDALDQMLQEAEEERYNQRDLDADMDAFHDAVENGSDLDTYDSGVEQNVALINAAETLAQDIEDAFHAHTMDRAPAWVEQQRRGVLNVGRYATRAPGDVEFFRQWTEDDMPGFDIAVTVMLDYSGSMNWAVDKLAQAGYACKLACQKLDLPCTVVLWDTEAVTLWDANEPCEHMPTIRANGGTVPDMALGDLDHQRQERSKHLVLIMSDGSWQGRWSEGGGGTLAWYKDDGRTIIGFGFARDQHTAQGVAHRLHKYGCDESFGITDLMDIPRYLEDALLALA